MVNRLLINLDVAISAVLFLVVETNLGKLSKFVAREGSMTGIKDLLDARKYTYS